MKPSMLLADLDLADAAAWPGSLKGVCFASLAIVVLAAGYLFFLADSRYELAAAEREQERLRAQAQSKTQLVEQRPSAEAWRRQARAALTALLRRLPADTEVPGLIEDISKAAVANGLTIDSLTLGEEKPADLYLELPIALAVSGQYHQFGEFAADIAALSRLVTLHDFDIKAHSDREGLTMTITAKTYRYTGDAPASGEVP